MAFNWQTFKTRTLTAIVFGAVMLVGLLWNAWSFFILFSIIHFGCWWEYLKLVEKIHQVKFHHYLKFGLMMMGFFLMIWFVWLWYNVPPYGNFGSTQFVLSIIPIGGLIFSMVGYSRTENISTRSFASAAFGLVYISLGLTLMISLRGFGATFSCLNGGGITGGPRDFIFVSIIIPASIVFSLWVNDTMAYIVGSFIGKTSLSKVSPKKTWEGTVGGIILSTIVIGLIFSNIHAEKTIDHFQFDFTNRGWYWYAIPLIASIAGTFGDLFESKLKRMAGVKDSGHIMPGHGGFLDRFDSLLFAVPFVWLYVYFFMR